MDKHAALRRVPETLLRELLASGPTWHRALTCRCKSREAAERFKLSDRRWQVTLYAPQPNSNPKLKEPASGAPVRWSAWLDRNRMLTKLIALLGVLALSLTVSVLTLMLGWGLQPKSWTAIVLLGFFSNLIIHTIGRKIIDEK